MKNILRRFQVFISIIAASALCLSLLGCGGCKSGPANAYKASTVTHVGVTAGIRAWDNHILQKQLEIRQLEATDIKKAQKVYDQTTNQIAQVKSAYEKYQATQIVVLNAAEEYAKATAAQDPNAPAAADKLTLATQAAAKTLADVMGLLTKFGVKIN